MIDHKNDMYICDHCSEQSGEFNTETGNHVQCETIAALVAERDELQSEVESRRENFEIMLSRLLKTEQERDELRRQVEAAMQQITDWRDEAYPLDIFPEPDLKVLRELFGDTNITLLSASNMRHVTRRVCEILAAALGKQAAG